MSPVSPVFHNVVTVRIGLKTQLEWEHPFHIIRCYKVVQGYHILPETSIGCISCKACAIIYV